MRKSRGRSADSKTSESCAVAVLECGMQARKSGAEGQASQELAYRNRDAGRSELSRDEQQAHDPPEPEPSRVAVSVAARGVIVADAEASMSIAVVGTSVSEENLYDSDCFLERATVWRLFWNHMVTVLRSLLKK